MIPKDDPGGGHESTKESPNREGPQSAGGGSREHPFGGDKMAKELGEMNDRLREWGRKEGFDVGTGGRNRDSFRERSSSSEYKLSDGSYKFDQDAPARLAKEAGLDPAPSWMKIYCKRATFARPLAWSRSRVLGASQPVQQRDPRVCRSTTHCCHPIAAIR